MTRLKMQFHLVNDCLEIEVPSTTRYSEQRPQVDEVFWPLVLPAATPLKKCYTTMLLWLPGPLEAGLNISLIR